MTEWLQCLDGTKALIERNPNVPEVLLRTEDAYGSTVTVRMNIEMAVELAVEIAEIIDAEDRGQKLGFGK